MPKLFVITLALWLFCSVPAVLAQTITGQYIKYDGPLQRLESLFNTIPSYSPATTESSLTLYIGQIINVFFALFGTIFIILMVYAGYNWMTASDNEKKVKTAKETIKTAILGLIITSGSYAIWQFLFTRLFN